MLMVLYLVGPAAAGRAGKVSLRPDAVVEGGSLHQPFAFANGKMGTTGAVQFLAVSQPLALCRCVALGRGPRVNVKGV